MISFKQYLMELNFGAYEKDDRFHIIQKIITDDMKKIVSPNNKELNSFENEIIIPIYTKYKSESKIVINLKWKLDSSLCVGETKICNSGSTKLLNDDSFLISFDCCWSGGSLTKYNTQLYNVIDTEITAVLLHELQHILDTVDDIFNTTHYSKYKKASFISSYKEKSDYVSQDIERNPQFLSVMADLVNIKKEYPLIEFNEALNKSEEYSTFKEFIRTNKLNHYKAKLYYFWFTKYGNRDRIK